VAKHKRKRIESDHQSTQKIVTPVSEQQKQQQEQQPEQQPEFQQGPVLILRNVSKVIGRRKIVDDVSFEVPRGEIFGFLGPNGAGKTTTIRLIVGLMRMTAGEVLINGYSIKTDFAKAIMKVGAVVENPEMYKYLTGYQNLVHFARLIPGIGKTRIDEVIKLVRLETRIHEKVSKYSLGMRQRLGIAQALLRKPDLLILDEPTNGLDPAGIREMRDYLREVAHTEGTAVFVSSHMLAEMELMCDRVAIIQQGKLKTVQTMRDLARLQGEKTVVFEVNQKEEALHEIRKYLLERASNGEVLERGAELVDDGVELVLQHEQIADINKRLVESGVRVYGIRYSMGSLEDSFLEVTGGEQVV
jgi:ABC-2 type transport system ATP-binding protein